MGPPPDLNISNETPEELAGAAAMMRMMTRMAVAVAVAEVVVLSGITISNEGMVILKQAAVG
jgi:hypothetical protein